MTPHFAHHGLACSAGPGPCHYGRPQFVSTTFPGCGPWHPAHSTPVPWPQLALVDRLCRQAIWRWAPRPWPPQAYGLAGALGSPPDAARWGDTLNLAWSALGAPPGTYTDRLIATIKSCLHDLGLFALISRAGAMAPCLAGFLAGPEAAPLVLTCLKIMGIMVTLVQVTTLLSCVATKMQQVPAPAPA